MNKLFLLLSIITPLLTQANTEIAIPLLPLRQQEQAQPFYFAACVAHDRNVRPYMEDRHQVYIDPKGIFLAVYDGHGGSSVAEYAKENLHIRLFEHPDFDSNIEKAIHETFLAVNKEVDRDEFGKAGTTAVMVLIKQGKIHVAWAGDSRAVVASGDSITESVDHKPRGAELERVRKSGGVFDGQYLYSKQSIHGIAMSRALGDRHLKSILLPDPAKFYEELKAAEFVIVASDGVWDKLSSVEAARIVRERLKKNPKDCEGAARELIMKSKCSLDNQTAIVASLLPPAPPKEPSRVWRWLSAAFCCRKASKSKEKCDDPSDSDQS